MPFCCQCGKPVQATDTFCAVCGARQAAATAPQTDYLGSINPRTAAILCYIPMIGWIMGIVVLASTRFRSDREIRFHAFQGLYLFVAWLIVEWVLGPVFRFPGFHFHPFPPVAGLLKAAVIGVWIYMMITVSQGRAIRLPIIGELADRSVSEQH
ncbi:MAG: hypothetical protein HY822_13335 [Acidobacteria bacterium]|nr:hypothetical protein [Acidobacteriota bacterium]